MTPFDKSQQAKFLKLLFTWYRKNGRHDMPWRKTKGAYPILVSEFMLQQTTVATVEPYFARFIKKFPSLKSLAEGDLNDVLALWSGLGYYARARNLWATARHVHENLKGKIPSEQKQLLKLPGIGPYISGAIATIAFNKPAQVLDGNIIRVLMRFLGLEDDPKLKAVQVLLQDTSQSLNELTKKGAKTPAQKKWTGPRNLSLALMDLGATVCIPRGPKCGECPLKSVCLANKYERQDRIPMVAETLERPTVRRLHAIIEHHGKWLVGQRPKKGLFGGLWEFIGADAPKSIEPVPFLEKAVKKEVGMEVQVKEALTAFEHQLSHRIMVIRSFFAIPKKGQAARLKEVTDNYDRVKWVRPNTLDRMGVSSITKRIILGLRSFKR